MYKLKTKFSQLWMMVCFSLTCLWGCNDANIEQTDLDETLSNSLVEASNGQGINFFALPQSTDYTNIPQDPNNPISDEKVALGKLLFHETGLGVAPKNGVSTEMYSCASCHHVAAGFQAGVAQGVGEGGFGFGLRGEGRVVDQNYLIPELDVQDVRSPAALHVAFQKNMLWNGQFGATGVNVGTEAQWTPGTPKAENSRGFEGVETQAIAGMDVHRLAIEGSICQTDSNYLAMFEAAFPNAPTGELVNLENAALAIAAYERTLVATEAPFQRWLRGERGAMSDLQKEGAILFFGKANCVTCHTGPALNSMEFYALGMNDLFQLPGTVKADITSVGNKGRGGFTTNPADMFKFKVPQLYNLKDSPFYGHGASFNTIDDVLAYKNQGLAQNSNVPAGQLATQFVPLNLSTQELNALKAFIEDGLYDSNLSRYVPGTLPSGNCFPNNDANSKDDLGCN